MKNPQEIIQLLPEDKQELLLQFAIDHKNGFLPLDMFVKAVIRTIRAENGACDFLEAVGVCKFLKN